MWRTLLNLLKTSLSKFHDSTTTFTASFTSGAVENVQQLVSRPKKIKRRHSVLLSFLVIIPLFVLSAQLISNTTTNKLKFVRQPLVGVIRFVRTMCYGALISADYKLSLLGLEEDSPRYKEKIKRIHLRSAKRMLKLALTHSGVYIKLGQYIAANNHIVPKEYVDTLKVLQDQAPYRDYQTIQQVFQEDFGKPLNIFFKEFDKTPLAAASLAQVHRAVTHDGREVAVKIQYPELQERFEGDMLTHRIVLKCIAWLFPKYDFEWTGEYMRNILSKELDFRLEGLNAEKAARHLAKVEDVYIPKVYWDLTSPRILSMEFIHGIKITDKQTILKHGFDPTEILTKMMKILGEQVFVHGFFHADPHPGNIFVRRHPKTKRSQIVLLDHGLYNTLSEQFRIRWCKMYRALVLNRVDEFKRLSEEMGIKNWKILGMMILFRPIEGGNVGMRGRISKERLRELFKEFSKQVDDIIETMKQLPNESLLLFRNQNLIRSINHEYGAPVNRFTIFARLAVQGLHSTAGKQETFLKRLQESFVFEYRIRQHEFIYWISSLWLSFLKWIGWVPKELTLEGFSQTESVEFA